MAGPSNTLGTPWSPLAIRPCPPLKLTLTLLCLTSAPCNLYFFLDVGISWEPINGVFSENLFDLSSCFCFWLLPFGFGFYAILSPQAKRRVAWQT
jgi:hypothetical protein